MARARNSNRRGNELNQAEWGHFLNLLKVLAILFVTFSVFHWIIIHQVQSKPATVLTKFIPKKWATANNKIYSVQEGDTLWDIAFKQYPARNSQEVILEIKKLNKLTTDSIRSGQPLRLP
ncbi:LysM peptidoglycan-binding domain-containing protein [Ammoniphilus oxalaticus]|nr:LysM peptidoglycan-binding domain-containing protein [Ammoniphilus oxalaticus]